MPQTITEYLDSIGVIWQPINLKNKVPQAVNSPIHSYMPKSNDYKNISVEEFKKRQRVINTDYIAICTDKVSQFDIDLPDFPFEINAPYFLSITKKLKHYFIKLDSIEKNRLTPKGGDILCGQWSFCKRDSIVYNAEITIPVVSNSIFQPRDLDKLKQVLKELKHNGVNGNMSYDEWIKVMFAVYNTAFENCLKHDAAVELCIDFSRDSPMFDEKAKKILNDLSYKPNGMKIGSLIDLLCKVKGIEKTKKVEEEYIFDDDVFGDAPVENSKKKKQSKTNALQIVESSDTYKSWKYEFEENYKFFFVKHTDLYACDFYSEVMKMYSSPKGLIDKNLINPDMMDIFKKCEKIDDNIVSYVDAWVYSKDKKSYNKFDFLPYPVECPENIYNTYTPMDTPVSDLDVNSMKLVENNFNEFIRHIGENDDACYHYIIQWLAHLIQSPGVKPGVCIVFSSDEGCGKGLLFQFIEKLIHKYAFKCGDIDQILGKFNSNVSRKLCVMMDEVSPTQLFGKSSRLKNLITEDKIDLERKGENQFQ
ncbi:MAG: PriCT-2 domain-containing protein, partial [Arcicella sp.]|nr:PriCT-2 domain-containing protein [Arcicella sp.]